MPTSCATHLDCAKNSDMLSSIESLVVQKALSDAARAFCDPSHFSKASVHEGLAILVTLFFRIGSQHTFVTILQFEGL